MVDLAITYEASDAYSETLTNSNQNNISFVRKHQTKCKNCGGNHARDKTSCPARQVTCFNCQKKGHFILFANKHVTIKHSRTATRERLPRVFIPNTGSFGNTT